MDWWPLAVAGVSLTLALVFGFAARRAQRRIGELEGKIDECKTRILDQANLLELLAEPDPTLDQLRDAAARAAAAAGGRLPTVES